MKSCRHDVAISPSPKDIGDIKAILMAQKGKLDLERLKRDAVQLLTGESYQELESLLTQFG